MDAIMVSEGDYVSIERLRADLNGLVGQIVGRQGDRAVVLLPEPHCETAIRWHHLRLVEDSEGERHRSDCVDVVPSPHGSRTNHSPSLSVRSPHLRAPSSPLEQLGKRRGSADSLAAARPPLPNKHRRRRRDRAEEEDDDEPPSGRYRKIALAVMLALVAGTLSAAARTSHRHSVARPTSGLYTPAPDGKESVTGRAASPSASSFSMGSRIIREAGLDGKDVVRLTVDQEVSLPVLTTTDSGEREAGFRLPGATPPPPSAPR
eukprot:Hpha_TRINITY_DN16084_c0_g2::TRINITY_DN16084_c0_g2_i1::g.120565::m.120565